VVAGTSRLFAVWSGEWSSDPFAIGDLDEYARAVGLVHDAERTGLANHDHNLRWTPSRQDAGFDVSLRPPVDVRFDFSCALGDLRVFAAQMRAQRGWNVAHFGRLGQRRQHLEHPRTPQEPDVIGPFAPTK
jgi:hypothetical protein